MAGVTDSFDPEDYGRLLFESTRLHQECREGQQRAEDKIDALTAAQRETKKELDEMRESLKERAGERKSNARWWAAAFAILGGVSAYLFPSMLDARSRIDRAEVELAATRSAAARHERELQEHEDSPGHAGNRTDIGAIRGDIRELGATVRSLTEAVRETQEDVREIRRRVR